MRPPPDSEGVNEGDDPQVVAQANATSEFEKSGRENNAAELESPLTKISVIANRDDGRGTSSTLTSPTPVAMTAAVASSQNPAMTDVQGTNDTLLRALMRSRSPNASHSSLEHPK